MKTVRSEQGRQKATRQPLNYRMVSKERRYSARKRRERNSPLAFVIGLRYSETGFRKKPINKTQSPKVLTNERKHDVSQGFHDSRSRPLRYGCHRPRRYADSKMFADIINAANKDAR